MQIVSGVFHPLLMAVYMSAILAHYLPEAYAPYPQQMAWKLVAGFFLLTAFFPALIVYGLYLFTPWVTHLELHERKERVLPFLILIGYYFMAGKFLVLDLGLGSMIQVLLISAVVLIGILVIINTRLKISIHCSAVWALAGYSLILAFQFPSTAFMQLALTLVVIAGWVGTSRLYLGYHQPKEVWAGTIFGFTYSMLVGYLFI